MHTRSVPGGQVGAGLLRPQARPLVLPPQLRLLPNWHPRARTIPAAMPHQQQPAPSVQAEEEKEQASPQPAPVPAAGGASVPARPVTAPRVAGLLAAAAAGVLGPLHLPAARAFDELQGYAADTALDPSLGEAPPLLDTLLVVGVTYLTVMCLFLWLSSFMPEDEAGSSSSSSSTPGADAPPDQADLPPAYNGFLRASVRSYVRPESERVTALRDLGQAQPLEGEDLEHLKHRLAAGAAEALALQFRECERLVRSKLLARKLGYFPARPAEGGSQAGAAPAQLSKADIAGLMQAAVMTAPNGLSSWQHRAAVEALIEAELDAMLPPGNGKFSEDLIARQVMRRLVAHLVMEESLLLLEGTEQGKRTLEAEGRGPGSKGGRGARKWALW